MDKKKLNNIINENISNVENILTKNNLSKDNKSTLENIKIYLEGIYSSKEEDIVIQQESIKNILKKINLKIKELEKT